jgi:hypothetical protein
MPPPWVVRAGLDESRSPRESRRSATALSRSGVRSLYPSHLQLTSVLAWDAAEARRRAGADLWGREGRLSHLIAPARTQSPYLHASDSSAGVVFTQRPRLCGPLTACRLPLTACRKQAGCLDGRALDCGSTAAALTSGQPCAVKASPRCPSSLDRSDARPLSSPSSLLDDYLPHTGTLGPWTPGTLISQEIHPGRNMADVILPRLQLHDLPAGDVEENC